MKDKSSIEIETSHAPTPRPYIVDVIHMPYRTLEKKVLTVYIIKYSDGSIFKFEKDEREDERLNKSDN
jgi:hypothetical protein